MDSHVCATIANFLGRILIALTRDRRTDTPHLKDTIKIVIKK